MFWYDPTATDLESGLHPVYGDKEIRDLQKNKMLNEDIDEFYIYFDHPIMEDTEFIDDDGVSVEEVDVQEASVENDGVDNDADVESSDSDDGYESTEDALYKPHLQDMVFRIQVQRKSQLELVRKERIMGRRNPKLVSLLMGQLVRATASQKGQPLEEKR
ncbi:hypothetical protein AHAS_Ahas11G0308300 [Arachis hypogaea]